MKTITKQDILSALKNPYQNQNTVVWLLEDGKLITLQGNDYPQTNQQAFIVANAKPANGVELIDTYNIKIEMEHDGVCADGFDLDYEEGDFWDFYSCEGFEKFMELYYPCEWETYQKG